MRLNAVFAAGLIASSLHVVAAQPSFTTVAECDLAGPDSRLSLLRGHPLSDAHVYKIRQEQETRFLYADADASFGSRVDWQCVPTGKGANVFVMTGEFSSNYQQGVLFFRDTSDRRIHRVEFAERNHPRWVLSGSKGPQVIFENAGYESAHKYLIYGPADAYLETDELPLPATAQGESLIELKPYP
ncbi:hypothetical protein [Pseudomonas kribbensis]|uniref:hypothetical protein n=1 Tax=Pseudomonas kribbensis TaxID=1628086 RepID=UPI0013B3D0FB|nr:hypothetical protein [Pseudomonas kribbensis]